MCLFSSLILIQSFLNLTVNHTFEFLSAAKGRRRGVKSRLLSYVFNMQFFLISLIGYVVILFSGHKKKIALIVED